MPGELDLNFYVKSTDGQSYIFKIANAKEVLVNLELQNALINHLVKKNMGLTVSSLVISMQGEEIIRLTVEDGSKRHARLLTWVEGRVFAEANPHSPLLLQRLGELCGNLCRSLADFDHPAAHRFMKWDTQQTEWIKPHLEKFTGERKQSR